MSVLTGQEILARGLVRPAYPKQTDVEYSWGLERAGYTLRLADQFRFLKRNAPMFRRSDGFFLGPLKSILASTVETVFIPQNLCAYFFSKSSYLRLGPLSGMAPGEPGWSGQVTLELFNAGEEPVLLCPGKGICQVHFHTLVGDLTDVPLSRYHGQVGPTAAKSA